MPAGPGYPFIPGGAPAVFRNTGVCMCTYVHSHGRLHGARVRGAKKRVALRIGACVAVLLAWRAACTQCRELCACVLDRVCACLAAIAIALACSCAWPVCNVICAKCAPMCKAGSIVHHMACGMRACWMKLNK